MIRHILRVIDSISEYTGNIACWLCVALVFVFSFETISRYFFNAPTNWVFDISWMLGASIIALGWSYVHLHKGHIRVDLFYRRLKPKGQAMVDIIGYLIIAVPVLATLAYASASWMIYSWQTGDRSMATTLLTPLAPVKTVVFIGICLFVLQSIAGLIRDVYSLVENK